MLILMLGFYAFLHCWLNAFAEMMRFADRMFYKVNKHFTHTSTRKRYIIALKILVNSTQLKNIS